MFDYHCNCCGFDFLMEEGYDNELDAITCPNCGEIQHEEYGGDDL